MRNELLNHLQLDDLKGETHELAETIGMDAFRRLVDVYGGTGRVYIPQADTLLIPIRDRLIREEYNGYNVYELCKKWDLGESIYYATDMYDAALDADAFEARGVDEVKHEAAHKEVSKVREDKAR